MTLEYQILFYGLFAFALWAFVLWRGLRTPMSWAAPTVLFAGGMLIFYIVPSIYWVFRPWNYNLPIYQEGLPILMLSEILMAVPFLWAQIVGRPLSVSVGGALTNKVDARVGGQGAWLYFIPVALGIAWRWHLLTIGYQSRLRDVESEFLGSQELGYLVGNISYYYPMCYYVLILLGNKLQRRLGFAVWAFDGFIRLISLHRYEILIYLLRSAVFIILIGWKFSARHKIFLSLAMVATITIVGGAATFAPDATSGGRAYLTPTQVMGVLGDSAGSYSAAEDDISDTIWRAVDDTMFRLYEARSASAVMASVPAIIPYYYGATFLDVLYSLIPRIIWKEKPDLTETHEITVTVMPGDLGINPLGGIAELYLNYGYPCVLFGGLICCLICRRMEESFLLSPRLSGAVICLYPILAELFISQSFNFSQRLSEGVRGVLVYYLLGASITLFLGKAARRTVREQQESLGYVNAQRI